MADVVVKIGPNTGDDYPTWAACETAEATDLVTAGNTFIAEWRAGNYTEYPVTITGSVWTTDATNRIKWRPQAGSEHDGIPERGVYFTTADTSNAVFLTVENEYVDLIGIEWDSNKFWGAGISLGLYGSMYQCIVRRRWNTGWGFPITRADGADNASIDSCLVAYRAQPAIDISVNCTNCSISNNTIIELDGGNPAAAFPGQGLNQIKEDIVNNAIFADTMWSGTLTGGYLNITNNANKTGTSNVEGSNQIIADAGDYVSHASTDSGFLTADYRPARGGTLDAGGAAVLVTNDVKDSAFTNNDVGGFAAVTLSNPTETNVTGTTATIGCTTNTV